jgi:hypothetical protein
MLAGDRESQGYPEPERKGQRACVEDDAGMMYGMRNIALELHNRICAGGPLRMFDAVPLPGELRKQERQDECQRPYHSHPVWRSSRFSHSRTVKRLA